jgi:hypothetical protein
MELMGPTSITNSRKKALNRVEPLILVIVQVSRRTPLLGECVLKDEQAVGILTRYFELDSADAKAPHFAKAIFGCRHV